MRLIRLTLALLCCCGCIFGQRLISFGVSGGIPFTRSFADQTFTRTPILPYIGSLYGVHSFSGANEYVIGPMIEFHLPLGFSVEADAFFRSLNLTQQDYVIGLGPEPAVSKGYSSWEFPVLAKYRSPGRFVSPFIEAGPDVRAIANPLSASLSKAGITVGIGLEAKILHFSIAPQVRFTHWDKDSGAAILNYIASQRNQGEFLVGLSF